jgi:TPR repeat protein
MSKAPTAPVLTAPRKSAPRLFLDLYLAGTGFRGFVDFAVIGTIVLAFIHGIGSIASLNPFASAGGSVPSVNKEPRTQGDMVKIGVRNSMLAPRLSELGLDESYFNTVAQPLRSQLVDAWRLYRAKQPIEAVELLRTAPDDPHVLLVRGLATIAQRQNGAFGSGVALIEQAAGKADPKSMAVLGVLHVAGVPGLQRDLEKGQRLLQQAASAGDVDASRMVGDGFASGWMGSIDPARAARYYRFAMDKGDAKSTFRLADMTMTGTGVAKDEREADRLAEKAAEQGNREAQTLVGMRKLSPYLAGLTDESEEALKWLNLAADQNEPTAMQTLATFYLSVGARTGQADFIRGGQILKRCVEKTADRACAFAYGETINAGIGEPRDVKRAFAMFVLASRGGNPATRQKLEELGKEMSSVDMISAQMTASQFTEVRE